MSPRRRPLRLLVAATVATVTVTGLGVLLGPAASDEGPAGAKEETSAGAGDEPTAEPTPTVPLPEVTSQRLSDFAAGDALPEGSRVFDSGDNVSGLAVAGGVLGHGAARGPAAGFVEAKLGSDVSLLGARVSFAGLTSGSVALVSWQSSLVKAHRELGPTPATGMRLVAGPGRWELSVVDGEAHVIGSGTYAAETGPAKFELRRDGATLYVVDPTGAATIVTDKRAERLAGPWASWGLTETGPEQVPASIEAVWAG